MKKSALIVILIAVFNYLPVFFAHHEPTQGASPNEKPTHLTAIMALISAGLAKPVSADDSKVVYEFKDGECQKQKVVTTQIIDGQKYETEIVTYTKQNGVSASAYGFNSKTNLEIGRNSLVDCNYKDSLNKFNDAYSQLIKSNDKESLLEAITGQIFSYTGLKQYDEAFKKINETKVKFSESYMKQLFEKDPSKVIDYYHSVAKVNYNSGHKKDIIRDYAHIITFISEKDIFNAIEKTQKENWLVYVLNSQEENSKNKEMENIVNKVYNLKQKVTYNH